MAVMGVLGVVVVILTVVMVASIAKRGGANRGSNVPAGVFRKTDLNFEIAKPPEPWMIDAATQNQVGANVIGYKRTAPDGWMTLSVRDYKDRQPRPSEITERTREQLARVFDNLPVDLQGEEISWGGHSGRKIAFRATAKDSGEPVVGEMRALGHQGIGYWVLTWCRESDQAALEPELALFRNSFQVLQERTSWKPSSSQEMVFRPTSGFYTVTDPERVWSKPKGKDPTDEDPKADFLLKGKLKVTGRRDFSPEADLVILLLDPAGDPNGTARKYVEERLNLVPDTKIETVEGGPEGDPPAAGADGDVATVVRLQARRGEASTGTADKFVVFRAFEVNGKLLVAEATCPLRERSVWERRLIQLVTLVAATP